MSWGQSDSWLLSAFVIIVAVYMVFTVVWNFYLILNHDALCRFASGGDEVLKDANFDAILLGTSKPPNTYEAPGCQGQKAPLTKILNLRICDRCHHLR